VLSSRDDTPAELLKLAMLPRVSVRFGQPASHIDAVNRTVTTADGMDFAYDQLVVATGSAAVASPVEGAGRCLSYSTIDDAADLVVLAEERESRDDLAASAGLETAATGGIVISQDFRTSVPGIWAIGDAAAFDGVRLGLLVAAASAAGACATQLVTAA
jgi:NAD(P)H-nitrite reductase large subunit